MRRIVILMLLLLAGCAPGHRAEWREPFGTQVRALGVSVDGERSFMAADGALVTRAADGGAELGSLPLGEFEPVALNVLGDKAIARSATGSEFLVIDGEKLVKFDLYAEADERSLSLGDSELSPAPGPITDVGVQDDGTIVACDTGGTVGFWDGDKLTSRIRSRGQVVGSRLSADGTKLALIEPQKLYLYKLPEAKKIGEFTHGGSLRGLIFSPDGSHLAATSASQVSLLKVDDLQIAASLPGVASRVTFSKDGRYVCIVNVGTIDVWDLQEDRERGSVTLLSVAQAELLGDVPHVVTLRKQGVDLWSLDAPDEPIWSYEKPIRMMQVKPDGVWVCTASGWLESWRLPLAR